MKTTINKLVCEFDLSALDDRYDFFKLTTTDRFIPSMAYVLDKPVEKIKAMSLAYEPKTKSAFAMFRKSVIGRMQLEEEIEDPSIVVSTIKAADLSQSFLIRLLLAALGNYSEEFQYNNVNGRFFITNPKWLSKNKLTMTACEFKVDQDLVLTAHAVSFTSVKLFSPKKIAHLPRYTYGGAHGALRRALASDEGTNVYVPKGPADGSKANLDFLRFDEGNFKYQETRCYLMYKVLRIFNETYRGLASITFEELEIKSTLGTPSDKRFMDGVLMDLRLRNVNLVNLCTAQEEIDTFEDICSLVSELIPCSVSEKIDPNVPNIVFLHEKGYYSEGDDPYSSFDRSIVIQAITVEDAGREVGTFLAERKPNENRECPVINTILKELAIKLNLRDGTLTMDDWSAHGYTGNYVFGTLYEDRLYFLTVSPLGKISCVNKGNDFIPFYESKLQRLSEEIDESPLKGKYIIEDDRGNVNIIGSTDLITLPNPEIFQAHEIRGKDARPLYLSGVTDINMYETEEGSMFNAGPQGSGMKKKLPKASRIYRIQVIEGHEIVSALLPLMAVAFVRYGDYTVLPYPFKYLREYIETAKPK